MSVLQGLRKAVDDARAEMTPYERMHFDFQSAIRRDLLLYGHARRGATHITNLANGDTVVTLPGGVCGHCEALKLRN